MIDMPQAEADRAVYLAARERLESGTVAFREDKPGDVLALVRYCAALEAALLAQQAQLDDVARRSLAMHGED